MISRQGKGQGLGQGIASGRKNAPSFIYEILHGSPRKLVGRSGDHRQKQWNGIAVDYHIPEEALTALNGIEEIEVRSSCEGSSIQTPTFVIFRFRQSRSEEEVAAFVQAMNSIDDIRCGAELGNSGMLRVGITTALWYKKDPSKFEQWWLELAVKIQVVLTLLRTLSSHSGSGNG